MINPSQPAGVSSPEGLPPAARRRLVGKTFIVRFKGGELPLHAVTAEQAEFHGDQLILLTSSGKPAALFLADLIESWVEIGTV
jgi:hypothetical protein